MHLDNFDVKKNNSICTNKFVFVILSYAVKINKFLRNYHFPRNPKILLSIGELQMPKY